MSVTVQRWTTVSSASVTTIAGVFVLLAFVPVVLGSNAIDNLTQLYVYVIIAAMWNALAGYAGLVSVGQQAFFGLGGYFAIKLTNDGMGVYPALVVSALIVGAISLPTSLFALQLRNGQFAIGMWVIAEVCHLLVNRDHSVGRFTGTSLVAIQRFSQADRLKYTYWLALASMAVLLGLVFLLLRSRLGASLQAIRDDEEAAKSVGVHVFRAKLVVFALAAVGSAAAGGIWLADQITFQPPSNFGVQWSAYMIFMVLVGGLGTFEGPIIGAVIFFTVEHELSNYGQWYLIVLGAIAILFALVLPRGLWGTVEEALGVRLLPIGYRLRGQLVRPPRPPAQEATPVPNREAAG